MNIDNFLAFLNEGEALLPCESLEARVINVTPEIAQKLIDSNFENNRNLKPLSVRRFAAMMAKGEFVAGSPIRVNVKDGVPILVDGQHRLTAVINSSIPTPFTLVLSTKGDVATEYAKLDTNMTPRSLSDAVRALDNGEVSNNAALATYAAACRLIASNFKHSELRAISKFDIYNLMKEYAHEIGVTHEWFGNLTPSARRAGDQGFGFYRSGVLSIALITARYANAAIAKNFWRNAWLDDGLRSADPRKRLADYLRFPQEHASQQAQIKTASIAVKCWNSFVAGEEILLLRMPATMAAISLTPYPKKNAPQNA